LHLAQDTGDEAPSQGSRPTQSKTDDDDDVPVPEIVPLGPIIGTGVGLGLSGQITKEVLVTEEQGRHTEQEDPHICPSPPPLDYIGITGPSISLT
ncbi:hypothetical protein KUCAC02_023143, partial [Chaenocephalus aceratus]